MDGKREKKREDSVLIREKIGSAEREGESGPYVRASGKTKPWWRRSRWVNSELFWSCWTTASSCAGWDPSASAPSVGVHLEETAPGELDDAARGGSILWDEGRPGTWTRIGSSSRDAPRHTLRAPPRTLLSGAILLLGQGGSPCLGVGVARARGHGWSASPVCVINCSCRACVCTWFVDCCWMLVTTGSFV